MLEERINEALVLIKEYFEDSDTPMGDRLGYAENTMGRIEMILMGMED